MRHFATGQAILMAPPGHTPHPHHNQQATALLQAKLTGGLHGGYVFNKGKLYFLAFWGGRIDVAVRNQAGDFDGFAQPHTSPTPQSTSNRVGAGVINQGITWRLRF